ncbi:MAG: uracil-DNA glycosylase [Candidatus Nanohaloarchaea archaeon]
MDFKQRYRQFFDGLDPKFYDQERFVPATGPEDAEVMLVGEAPGADEVEQGEPFVGRAGKRLDEILGKMGVSRNDIYITNLVKIRPPDNRDPKRGEIDAWKPLLDREIEHVEPETIVTLGNFATKELTGTSKGISSVHGQVFHKSGRRIVPVYHPAATLYDRSKMPELEDDLRKVFGKRKAGQTSLKDL